MTEPQIALSIRQPWAYAILNLGKDIENRTWYSNFRGKVLIHAGLSYDFDGEKFLTMQRGLGVPRDLPKGGIIGTIEITGCVSRSTSPWFFGPYGFTLVNPIKLPFISCKGRLGFLKVDLPGRLF